MTTNIFHSGTNSGGGWTRHTATYYVFYYLKFVYHWFLIGLICLKNVKKSLSYNAAALPGSLFVNNAINGAVETLAYVVLTAAMPFVGRKKLTSVS